MTDNEDPSITGKMVFLSLSVTWKNLISPAVFLFCLLKMAVGSWSRKLKAKEQLWGKQ